jgi:hypothetical protein
MAIDFECPCGKKLKSKDEFAGKRTKCPQCGAGLTVPQPAHVVAAEAAAAAAKAQANGPEHDSPLALDMSESSVKIEPISTQPTEAFIAPRISPEASPIVDEAKIDGRQYKVLMSKDMGFVAKFDAVKLEESLNTWARQGWCLRSAFMMTHQTHSGTHNDILVIMER